MAYTRTKKLTDASYSPPYPASETEARAQIDGAIQEILDRLEAFYTENTGDHKGTWNGLQPTQSQPGLEAAFNAHKSDEARLFINPLSPPAPLSKAKFDNSTDDTAALQACINYIISNGKGKLILPQGTALHTGLTIAVQNTSLSIIGAGAGMSILKNTSTNDAFTITGNVSMYNLLLEGFSIFGNNVDSGHGINITDATSLVTLRRLEIKENNKGIVADGCWTMTIDNCWIEHNRSNGVEFTNSSNHFVITGNSLIKFNYGAGIIGSHSSNVIVENSDIEGNNYDGINLSSVDTPVIQDNYIEQNGQLNDITNKYADIVIGQTGVQTKNSNISNNFINSKLAEHAIWIKSAYNFNIERNHISQATSGTTANAITIENDIDTHTGTLYRNMTNLAINDYSKKCVIIDWQDNNKYNMKSNGNMWFELERASDSDSLGIRMRSSTSARRAGIMLDPTTNDIVFYRYTGGYGGETEKEYARFKQIGLALKIANGLELNPTLSSSISTNNTFFVDSSTNTLKFKDNSGTVKTVNLI